MEQSILIYVEPPGDPIFKWTGEYILMENNVCVCVCVCVWEER